jgi:hypothetical protein
MITREFNHRTFGAIGKVTLEYDVTTMKLNGMPLGADSVEYLLTFALQSLQDAYAGAKTEAEAQAAFAKKRDAVIAGTIGQRTSSGISEETRVARQVVRALLKAKFGAKSQAWAEFTGKDDKAQDEYLDEVFAKNKAKLQSAVDARLEELKREREAKRKLGAGVEIEL